MSHFTIAVARTHETSFISSCRPGKHPFVVVRRSISTLQWINSRHLLLVGYSMLSLSEPAELILVLRAREPRGIILSDLSIRFEPGRYGSDDSLGQDWGLLRWLTQIQRHVVRYWRPRGIVSSRSHTPTPRNTGHWKITLKMQRYRASQLC